MQRTPLGPISGNRPRGPDLTPKQRGIIIRAASAGKKKAWISNRYKIPFSTIKSTLKQAALQPDGYSKPYTGRPPKFTERDQRHLIRVARVEPTIEYGDLIQRCDLKCLKSTVYRALKEYGLTNWLAQKRPLLSEDVARKRLA